MNQIVISLVKFGTCPVCADHLRVQVRRPANRNEPGGVVGWADCPLCVSPAGLVEWIEPFVEPAALPEVIA